MKQLFKEPLVHFILLGAMLFLWHSVWEARQQSEDYTVTISEQKLDAVYQKNLDRKIVRRQLEPGAALSDADKEKLRTEYIHNQILVREAQRMGLGQNDETVERRLLQKMHYMISEKSKPSQPSEAELKAYFDANPSRFMTPERRSYREIFLDEKIYAEDLASKIKDIEITLKGNPAWWPDLGEMISGDKNTFTNTQNELTRKYGREFSGAVFTLEPETWSGPIPSPDGVHFIYIEKIAPERPTNYEEVKHRIEFIWTGNRTQAAYDEHIDNLIQKYSVVMGE